MRRALLLALFALAALAPVATAGPTLKLGATKVSYLAVDRSLWIHVQWTPPARSTDVTLVVRSGDRTLRTLRATHWLVGSKTFDLPLPRSLPDGSTVSVQVQARSSAGSDRASLSVPLR